VTRGKPSLSFFRKSRAFVQPGEVQFRRKPDVSEAVGELVEHLGASEVRRQELAAALGAAEGLLQRRPTAETIQVAGEFIEDLQLLASYPDMALGPEDVEVLLPKACLARWDALDAEWRSAWRWLGAPPSELTMERYWEIADPRLRRLVRNTHRVMPEGRLVGVADVLMWETENASKSR
jgi:hypothetical protein